MFNQKYAQYLINAITSAKNGLQETGGEEGQYIASSSTTVLGVGVDSGCYNTVHIDQRGQKVSEEAIKVMCFALTGDTNPPLSCDIDLLKKYMTDGDTIRDFVDEMTKAGVVPVTHSLIVFNETMAQYQNSLGRWMGFALRHYPLASDSINPFIVAARPPETISDAIKESASLQWEAMDIQERTPYGSKETFEKYVACLAIDQIALALYSIKNGSPSATIRLNIGSTSPLHDRDAKSQPLFDRVSIFNNLNTATILVNTEGELRLSVGIDAVDFTTLVTVLMPMFSAFLSIFSKEVGKVPGNVEFVVTQLYFKIDDATISALSAFCGDDFEMENRKTISTLPIPSFVPDKSMLNFTAGDIFSQVN